MFISKFIVRLKSYLQFKKLFSRKPFVYGFLIVSALLLFLLLYIFCSWYFFRDQIALLKLRQSFVEEKICRESCREFRLRQKEIISRRLAVRPERLNALLRTYLLQADEDREFKKELLRLWRASLSEGELPDFLEKYLEDERGDPELQALIIKLFLEDQSVMPPLDYYFSLISQEEPRPLQEAAIQALSNLSDKERYFTAAQIKFLEEVILKPLTPAVRRTALVQLLSEYYPFFPEATRAALIRVYEANNLGDSISRAFSADILNRLATSTLLELPEISASEWQAYYQQ